MKLDTNGSRPDVLEVLLSQGLLDYVALDVKAPAARYEQVAGVPAAQAVGASPASFSGRGPERGKFTTVVPGLLPPKTWRSWREIALVPRYVLQPFRPGTTWDPTTFAPPPSGGFEGAACRASALLPHVMLRSDAGDLFREGESTRFLKQFACRCRAP